MTWNLRNKFLVPTSLVVALGMGLCALAVWRVAGAGLQEAGRANLAQAVDLVSRQTSTWLEQQQASFALWAQQKVGQAALQDAAHAQQVAGPELVKFEKQLKLYEEMLLVGGDGKVIACSNPKFVGVSVADRDYYRAASEGRATVSAGALSKGTNKPIFTICAPIVGGDGKPAGAMVGVVDLGLFTEKFIDPIKVGKAGYVFIVDQAGVTLAHPDRSRMAKDPFKQLDFGARMIEGKQGVMDYDFKGVAKVAAFTTEPTAGWLVATAVDRDVLMASANKVRKPPGTPLR